MNQERVTQKKITDYGIRHILPIVITDKNNLNFRKRLEWKMTDNEDQLTSISPIILTGIKRAIEISKKSNSTRGEIHPNVGVVIIKEDQIIQEAYRGELAINDHAEYTALIKKRGSLDFKGAILITTLEPCISRRHTVLTCAEHIVNSGISHVWIGMIDPNKEIHGKGEIFLIDKGVTVDRFPSKYTAEIKEINREFWEFMVKDYRRDIMSTGGFSTKNPILEFYFENSQKVIKISPQNPEPTELMEPYEPSQLTFLLSPSDENINQYNSDVEKWNEWRRELSQRRLIGFILSNIGTAPATNIDIYIKAKLERGFNLQMPPDIKKPKRPQYPKISDILSPLGAISIPPIIPQSISSQNVGYHSAKKKEDQGLNTWRFGYHINNLKHKESVIFPFPLALIVPNNTERKEILFEVSMTVQEPTEIPNQELKLVFS